MFVGFSNLGEVAARFSTSHQDWRDLTEITKISSWCLSLSKSQQDLVQNSPRFERHKHLSKIAYISPRDLAGIWKEQESHRNLSESGKILMGLSRITQVIPRGND